MKFTPELTPERKAQIKANRWAHRQLRKCRCLDCERARAVLKEEEKRKIEREKAKRLAKEIERYGCTEEEHLKKVRKEREKEDEIVEAGFKALAKKLHPDHGGTDEEMKELLRLREKMKNTWLRL